MTATGDQTRQILDALARAYNAELETVMNYIAHSVNLDGVHAKSIKTALAADIAEELNHAQTLARRMKTIGGQTPGSMAFKATQKSLQPPAETTDIASVIKGVIAAEEDACRMYEEIIRISDGVDPVTQDLAVTTLADEQEHLREFRGFLKEYGDR